MAVITKAEITISRIIDIASVTRYYKLQSSTASAPSVPTTNPPSGWTATEPSYTTGSTNTLYFVDLTVFTNDTYKYSAVSMSSSYEAAKAAYNKAIAAVNAAEAAQNSLDASLDIIVGTQTAITGAWTGVAKFSELKDGQQILYWLPYSGSGNATLNLTLTDGSTTGAINCYWRGSTRLTTHFPAGSAIRFVYRKDAVISGGSTKYTGWWADASFDSGNTYDRTRYSQNIHCGTTAITAYNIIVGKYDKYSHLKSGESFEITYPILYANANISANGTGNNNYLTIPFAVKTTQDITLTIYKPVYIKGTLSGSLFTPVSTTPLTQTAPTYEDGYHYILLGTAYSTTSMYLLPEHPIFMYYNGAFKSFQQIAAEAATNIDNLEIGGRNLILNSDSFANRAITSEFLVDNSYQKLGNNSFIVKNNNTNGSSKKYVTVLSATVDNNYLSINLDEAKSKNLIFSMWMYVEEVTFTGYEFRVIYTKNGVTQRNVVNKNYPYNIPRAQNLVPGWNFLYGVFSISDDTTKVEASVTIYCDAGASGECWVSSPKLEFGNRPTTWSPAPEDMASSDDIDEANQSIEDLDISVNSRFELLENRIATLSESMSNLVIDENGMTLMEQVGDGYQFSMGKFISSLQGVSDQIEAAEDLIDSNGGDIIDLQEALTGLAIFNAYMRVGSDDDGNPYLELGNEESQFNIQITNTEINFRNGDNVLAYITNETLQINKADVEDELVFGGFAFKKRENGNMGLIWKG